MPDRPVILSQAMVDRALADNGFYGQVPEFSQLRGVNKTTVPAPQSGCGGCRRSSYKLNMFQNFVTITTALPLEARGRLKRYFGVNSIMLNTYDRQTQKVAVQVI
jgi:hypothetical protein